MCTAGRDRRRHSTGNAPPSRQVPDPTEVLHTCKGGAVDPHTRLGGYTMSTMLGISQVWFVTHHVGHVMKTLRSGRLEELHRRMKRNPHVLDVKVCRAVLWWNILGEAMDAAREAGKRRSRRRETKRLVIALAISQRRAGGERPSSSSYQGKEIEYSCSLSSLQSEDVDESLSPYPSSAGMGHNSPLSCLKEGFYPEDFVSEEMEWSAVPASFRWRMEQWRPPAPSAFVKMEDDDHDGREVGLRVEDAEEQGDLEAAGWQRVHLDEAAVLRRVYDYL